ncbi:MAG: Tyrosine-protein phosphatase YwqE [Pelotomaculum sp. PtaB.Bin104]|nr:MAG: Tyrosine-protein phosphatase YwqE [Pelotomaculum sp. PtaB.Bin104]
MIDIHSHILPGIDDGATSPAEAVAMARCAVAGGIRCMVATPHVTGQYPNVKEGILQAVKNFRQVLQEEGIFLDILPGAEYLLEPDLPGRLSRGELMTINDTGRYLLVELPATLLPDFTLPVFYELQLQGVTPIIAHPERNSVFARDPSALHELVGRGALAQLTAGSLSGLLGPLAAATARKFLAQSCAHFIASDAHAATGRAPELTHAFKKAARLAGEAQALSLVNENPVLAIRGERIKAEEIKPINPARRSIFDYLRGIF